MLSRRRIIVIAAVVVAVAVVALGSYFISSNTKQDTSAALPNSPAPSETSRFGFPVSDIGLGEGGSSTTPNRGIRVGYTASCEDATRAALNYVAALSYSPKSWGKQEAELKQILSEDETTRKYAAAISGMVKEYKAAETYSVLEPGIYKIANCDPGKSASVHIAVKVKRESYKVGEKVSPESTSIYFSAQQVVWQNGDWKLNKDPLQGVDPLDNQLVYTGGQKAPTSQLTILDDLFTDAEGNPVSREGWSEVRK